MKNRQLCRMTGFGLALTFAFGGFQVVQAANGGVETYVAKLKPMNSEAAGSKVRGEVRFTVSGDNLTIHLKAEGLPPDMMHMAHLHGFISGKDAVCPAESADVNHDGVVDLNETEASSGTTLVPLNADPAELKIASDTYRRPQNRAE
jgi:hypothetical protein